MKFRKVTITLLISSLLLFVIGNSERNSVTGFEIGTIEDRNEWVISTEVANFSNEFNAKMAFGFENETLGLGLYPYLTFHTDINIPFNLTGYLNKDIKKETSTYGIQVSGHPGNITIGLNGTIIVKTPVTDNFFILIEEDSSEITANFDSFIGDDVSLPINFNAMTIKIDDPDVEELNSISLELKPIAFLEGTISISVDVNGEKLEWKTGDEIYFDSVNITKDLTDFYLSVENISLNFDDLSLVISGIDTTIILETELGSFKFSYPVDLRNVEWTEGQQQAGHFLMLLIDTLVILNDQVIFLSVFRAPVSLYGTLIAIIVFSTVIFVRKRRLTSI